MLDFLFWILAIIAILLVIIFLLATLIISLGFIDWLLDIDISKKLKAKFPRKKVFHRIAEKVDELDRRENEKLDKMP